MIAQKCCSFVCENKIKIDTMKNKKTPLDKTDFEQLKLNDIDIDIDDTICIPNKSNIINKPELRDHYVFVFDLDNTLVKTNRANNNAGRKNTQNRNSNPWEG